ncbi:membrane protein [Aminobacter aminovorans]|jgi:uncharacterized membrane protein YfcA|uniref:Probable membrane transporter protein n=1 Tax=Aminobacter aminovorans TaxID=83263 RepID=A0AAC8YKB7_AMIAI|nr:membrane protein [Aminobacter aminovorans]
MAAGGHKASFTEVWDNVPCLPCVSFLESNERKPPLRQPVSLVTIGILFLAGFLSGVVNAIAGGGTFLTFGAMTMLGVPPISANATSSIAQFPGYITSTWAYMADIRQMWRGAVAFAIISAVGALAGALILLSLDNVAFGALVPWLLLAATALFAAGPWLRPKKLAARAADAPASLAGRIVQFFTSIYGGFFGAGMGVMMLATLGLTEGGDYHRLNALKNMLSIVIAAVAIIIFASGGVVAWTHAAIMVPGVALGGYAGVWTARRVPQALVRTFVVAVGLFLAGYYFTEG